MNDKPIIVVAEDDEADILLMRAAARKAELRSELVFVSDGEELLDYLTHEGPYTTGSTRPYLVLLDLNMPRMNGMTALREMRITAESRTIPVVVLSTTDRPEQIRSALALGANSFVVKPMGVAELARLLATFETYWLDTVARV